MPAQCIRCALGQATAYRPAFFAKLSAMKGNKRIGDTVAVIIRIGIIFRYIDLTDQYYSIITRPEYLPAPIGQMPLMPASFQCLPSASDILNGTQCSLSIGGVVDCRRLYIWCGQKSKRYLSYDNVCLLICVQVEHKFS